MQTVLLTNQQTFVLTPDQDTFYLLLLDQNAGGGKIQVDLSLTKNDLHCQLLFIGILKSKSDWQLISNIKHLAPNSTCLTEVYLSQMNESKVDYFGRIYIDSQAAHTQSFLKEQSLIMGQDTYNRSRPTLEIFNHRVQASHSASISRPDETALFYLMSRGLTKIEAEKMVEKAFFNHVLDSIKVKKARQLIEDYLPC
ncbi:MAG TPA: SufD family Fe-S cluster assembly protein [Candidatus Woesebacteria bacterium]|nr:SufD family Fe-S cluster assembly protein [Candidatus Woesebacteria bacterium]